MLHTVRQTFSRFIAIFAIVALGVGFLAGLLSTTPDIRYSGDLYFDDTRLFDLRVAGSMGLSDANVSAIRAVEGVEDVMPAYAADVLTVTPDGDTAVTRLHSLPFDKADDPEARGYLNRISLVDGRLPEKANECVVQQSGQFSGKALRLGDQISVSPDNKDLTDTLAVTQYTIVGLAESSYYCSIERESASVGSGTLGLILYVREDAFSLPVYSTVYLTVKGAAAKNSLQDAYTDLIDPVEQRLEDIGDAQSALRLSEVKADAQEKLDDAKQEYADAKAEAAEKLGDAADELEEAARKLADGRSQIRENEQKLADAKTQIDSGQSELDAGRQSYAEQMAAGRSSTTEPRSTMRALPSTTRALPNTIRASPSTTPAMPRCSRPRITLPTTPRQWPIWKAVWPRLRRFIWAIPPTRWRRWTLSRSPCQTTSPLRPPPISRRWPP